MILLKWARRGGWGLCLAGIVWSGAAAEPLVKNGDFETPDPAHPGQPLFWDKPDGLGVQWANAPEAAHGKAIRIDTAVSEKAMVESWRKAGLTNTWNIPNAEGNAVAETYGLSYYSQSIPVVKGQPYKITFDYEGASAGAKMWVRGYGTFEGERRRRWETTVECRVASSQEWTTISQEFFPTRSRPDVTEMRVMLYAFYPAGVYWFDNVKIEPITLEEYERLRKIPAPAAHGRKPKKPPE